MINSMKKKIKAIEMKMTGEYGFFCAGQSSFVQ